MAEKIQSAALPPDLDLQNGYVIRVNAVDPTTGAHVTGVTVTDLSILVSDVAGNLGSVSGQPILVGAST